MTKSKTTAPRAQPGRAKAAAPKRKRADWEAIERDYMTGAYSLRELATKHAANHATIGRRVEKEGWTKDLTTAIRQATNAKLIEDATRQNCDAARQSATTTVLVAAELNKQVILAHRSRVNQATDVAMRMLAELDATTSKADQIEALFEVLTDEMDEKGKAAAQQQLREFMRLHSRVGSVHKLMDALGKAQTLERQAFGIGDGDGDAGKNKQPQSVHDMDDDDLLAEILADRRARAAA